MPAPKIPADFQQPKLFEGQVVFVMGKRTYSSAGMLLTNARDHHVGTIIGTTSTFSPSHYGEVLPYRLPNTDVLGSISCKYFARPDTATVDDTYMQPDIEVNLDDKDAYFQIGAHPGFLLPDYNPDNLINGYVRFYNKNDELIAPAITHNLDNGNRVKRDSKILLLKETPLMPNTFIHDAFILEEGQVSKVELWNRFCEPVLNVSCPQAEAFGIWAPHKEGCPFVCLEPWCGICDARGYTGDISQRTYSHRLAPDGQYRFTYTIDIL